METLRRISADATLERWRDKPFFGAGFTTKYNLCQPNILYSGNK